jgi:hypothetical protein
MIESSIFTGAWCKALVDRRVVIIILETTFDCCFEVRFSNDVSIGSPSNEVTSPLPEMNEKLKKAYLGEELIPVMAVFDIIVDIVGPAMLPICSYRTIPIEVREVINRILLYITAPIPSATMFSLVRRHHRDLALATSLESNRSSRVTPET